MTLIFIIEINSKHISLIQNKKSIFKLIKIKNKINQPNTKQTYHFKITTNTKHLYNTFNNFHKFSITNQYYFLYILIKFLSK